MEEQEASFVIIGGGIAGVSCAEGLQCLCPEEKTILLTASPVVKRVTNVVPLTKMLAKFDVEEITPDSVEQESLIVIQDPVASINSSNHTVTSISGRIFRYKKLCVCTGGVPRLISTNEHVIGIRDTESVASFQKRVANSQRIVVVGNGGIATEIVYELTGVEIVWVIKDNHISAPFIDPGAAEFFQDSLKQGKLKTEDKKPIKRKVYTVSGAETVSGGAALGPDWHTNYNLHGKSSFKSKVNVEYNCEVSAVLNPEEVDESCKIVDEKWPVYVKLTNGRTYGCDLIVSATGVVPNSDIVFTDGKQFDLAEDKGIRVNEQMETNVMDIFAAGDVCTPVWELAPHWFQMRLWTQAHQMGSYVAKTMHASLINQPVLQDFCFELFTHVTNFFGYNVVILGLFNAQKLGQNYSCLLRVTPGVEYLKIVMKEGRMQGAVLIGDTDLEEMCENLILNQLDLTNLENDLLNPDIDMDDYFD
ncbi:hypothetical protein LSTR_LSTR005430 [Laodelphax striatellus]|uniref:Pyridine nucleotide-disulfide oxidoreductase domain-containing protein 1 n=1 Tax=Laodelphax striatellus TaxID=195883 RepID=A0A482WY08_LAOST|nr:hypothetical protein LSTR_LSTR005430 [Laodelphax striatellus]